jgi:hypothetical protein
MILKPARMVVTVRKPMANVLVAVVPENAVERRAAKAVDLSTIRRSQPKEEEQVGLEFPDRSVQAHGAAH